MSEKKVSSGTVICLIIIFILIMCLAGMWYYYNHIKVVDNNETNEIISSEAGDVLEDNENLNQIESNLFDLYQENYKNTFKQIITEYNDISIYLGNEERKDELPGVVRVFLDSKNDAYFEFDKNSQLYAKYGEKYKVEDNIANIFVCPDGNGGYSDAIFLKLDGTAYIVRGYKLKQSTEVQCKKVENVTNAINVISYTQSDDGMTGAWTYQFIDINGNIIK